MGNTVSRIKQYIDYKGISIRKFEESVGFSNGAFASQYKNDKTIGVDKVENILQNYTDLNPGWLLTGEGEMIKASDQSVVISAESAELNSMKDDLIASLKKQVVMLEDKVNELQRAPASRDFGSARTPSTLLAADTSPGIPTQSADRAQVPTK